MSRELAKKDQWSQAAEQYASEEKPAGAPWITTRGGVFSQDDEELGRSLCVIIVDSLHESTYYPDKWDADNPVPPRCFAFGRNESEMEPAVDLMDETDPDEEWFEAQADSCAECPMAEWGSSDTGRGKACQNRRRLAVIPAGEYDRRGECEIFDDAEHFEEADIAFLKVPVTSVKHWSKFVQKCTKAFKRPPFGVIAEIRLEPDSQSQYRMEFDILDEVPEEFTEIVFARHDEAREIIATPYRPPHDEPEAERPKRGGLKGLKKKSRR